MYIIRGSRVVERRVLSGGGVTVGVPIGRVTPFAIRMRSNALTPGLDLRLRPSDDRRFTL